MCVSVYVCVSVCVSVCVNISACVYMSRVYVCMVYTHERATRKRVAREHAARERATRKRATRESATCVGQCLLKLFYNSFKSKFGKTKSIDHLEIDIVINLHYFKLI